MKSFGGTIIDKDEGNEEQGVRCLRLVHHLRHVESATSAELYQELGVRESLLQADVAALRRGGLFIDLDANARYTIVHAMPGFSLRLTRLEAAVAWLRFWYCGALRLIPSPDTPAEILKEASATLQMGLHRHHADSQDPARHPGAMCLLLHFHDHANQTQQNQVIPSGSAKRVYRRLRILELVECGKARHRDQLVTLLGESDRTIGSDIAIMRRAGLKISYVRSDRTYSVCSLHTHIAKRLSQSRSFEQARILWQLLVAPGEAPVAAPYLPIIDAISQKVEQSLHLIYGPSIRGIISASGEIS